MNVSSNAHGRGERFFFLARWIARLGVGGAMVAFGSAKLWGDPDHFLKIIRLYQMFPEAWSVPLNLMVVIIPWVELLGGAAVILGVLRRGAPAVLAAMLVVFTTAIVVRAVRMVQADGISFFAVQFDCGCGLGTSVIWIKLLENFVLLALSVYLFLSNRAASSTRLVPRRQHVVESSA